MRLFNKRFEWSLEKNEQIHKERGICFEEIVVAIEQGRLLDITKNPSKNHDEQRVLIVDIDGYIVLAPFIENKEKIFLKTAYKSRKATREYLGG